MKRRRCRDALRLVLLTALLPCALAAAEESTAIPASVSARVSPQSIRIGEPAFIEFAIVTPPAQRLLPFALPVGLESVEIEAVEDIPVEMRATGWTHRTRVRFRPRETGILVWPRTEFAIEAEDGSIRRQTLEPVAFDVPSVLSRFPGRSEPFGARSAPTRRAGPDGPSWIVYGAVVAAGLAALLALRRVRGARKQLGGEPSPRARSWTLALSEFERAAGIADPAVAADTTAGALRQYMRGRFGASTEASTAEELRTAKPPFAATSRWPHFTDLLLELDEIRFAPPVSGEHLATARNRIDELLQRARNFVSSSIPPEPLQ